MAQHKARPAGVVILALILAAASWPGLHPEAVPAAPPNSGPGARPRIAADSMARESEELPADLPDPDSGAERIGRPAPEFAFARWARGGPLRIADLRGKVVLVRFWTDQCRFCRATLPSLERLRARD